MQYYIIRGEKTLKKKPSLYLLDGVGLITASCHWATRRTCPPPPGSPSINSVNGPPPTGAPGTGPLSTLMSPFLPKKKKKVSCHHFHSNLLFLPLYSNKFCRSSSAINNKKMPLYNPNPLFFHTSKLQLNTGLHIKYQQSIISPSCTEYKPFTSSTAHSMFNFTPITSWG